MWISSPIIFLFGYTTQNPCTLPQLQKESTYVSKVSSVLAFELFSEVIALKYYHEIDFEIVSHDVALLEHSNIFLWTNSPK